MAIRVTCSKCHTRFNVSDKFAGQGGPCPKCKTKIRIPDKSEEVVIEAPKSAGPADSQGRPILKPIARTETVLSTLQKVIIAVCIIAFLAISLVLRTMITDRADFPVWLLAAAALLVAPALVYGAYTVLRNQDLDAFFGRELWTRVGICSAIYAASWLALPIAYYAFNNSYEVGSYVLAGIVMLAIGGVAGMYCLDMDYLMGSVHYGLYLGICLLGRAIAGLGLFPTNLPGAFSTTTTTTTSWLEPSNATWPGEVLGNQFDLAELAQASFHVLSPLTHLF